jgi:two-component system LytT family response regulator
MAEIRILVADDEPLARRGVRQLLAPHDDLRVVGESRNGPDTLRALEELKPTCSFSMCKCPRWTASLYFASAALTICRP